jgi:hypothetical protein
MRVSLVVLALAGLTSCQEPALWGGNHIRLETSDKGASLELDCAHGSISEPIVPNAKGAFELKGVLMPEHGGPMRIDEVAHGINATFSGTIKDDAMTLKMVVEGQEPEGQTFKLTRGKEGVLMKCR